MNDATIISVKGIMLFGIIERIVGGLVMKVYEKNLGKASQKSDRLSTLELWQSRIRALSSETSEKEKNTQTSDFREQSSSFFAPSTTQNSQSK